MVAFRINEDVTINLDHVCAIERGGEDETRIYFSSGIAKVYEANYEEIIDLIDEYNHSDEEE